MIGRGLRRVSYETEQVVGPDGQERALFRPEFVNVFGVPLSIFQDDGGGEPPPPPKHSTQIESIKDRSELEVGWPNVLRVNVVVRPELVVDWLKDRGSSSTQRRFMSAPIWLRHWEARRICRKPCPSTWKNFPRSSACSA